MKKHFFLVGHNIIHLSHVARLIMSLSIRFLVYERSGFEKHVIYEYVTVAWQPWMISKIWADQLIKQSCFTD